MTDQPTEPTAAAEQEQADTDLVHAAKEEQLAADLAAKEAAEQAVAADQAALADQAANERSQEGADPSGQPADPTSLSSTGSTASSVTDGATPSGDLPSAPSAEASIPTDEAGGAASDETKPMDESVLDQSVTDQPDEPTGSPDPGRGALGDVEPANPAYSQTDASATVTGEDVGTQAGTVADEPTE